MDQISDYRRLAASGWRGVDLPSLFEAGLCASLLYGANLYFSKNANINDPIVPIWWPIAKDAILTTLFGYLVVKLWPPKSLTLFLTVAFATCTAALCMVRFGISVPPVTFAKNLVLYFAGGAVLGAAIAGKIAPSEIGERVLRAISISLVASVACTLLPVQPLDERLYGTYGNPTSFGFSGFALLVIITAFRPKIETIAAAFGIGAIYIMAGSISVVVAAIAFFLLLSMAELLSGGSAMRYAWHLAAIPASIALLGPIFHYLQLPDFGYERLATLLGSDSFRLRMIAFTSVNDGFYHRYDSFFVSLYKNFGIAPLLMYSAIVASLAWQYINSARGHMQTTIAAGLACLLVLNPLLQHQLEIFPTNLLFGVFVGLGAVWLERSNNSQQLGCTLTSPDRRRFAH